MALTTIAEKFSGKAILKEKSNFPKESYDDFILKVLNKKKKRIEEELDL